MSAAGRHVAGGPVTVWDPASADPADEYLSSVEEWSSAPSLWQVVGLFGGRPAPQPDLADRLAYLNDFAQQQWDFRQGAERNQVTVVPAGAGIEDAVAAMAADLGFTDSRPPTRSGYSDIMVLGGLIRACIVRPRYAARLLAGGIATPSVVALGGFRELKGDELAIRDGLGMPADVIDEFGAMAWGVRDAFAGLGEASTETGSGPDGRELWRVDRLSGGDLSVEVVAAPPADPAGRANTADTYRFWAGRAGEAATRASLLLVTNPIYVAYQHSIAIGELAMKHRIRVETVGVPPALADIGRHTQRFQWHHYLQETRSTIFGINRLLQRLGG